MHLGPFCRPRMRPCPMASEADELVKKGDKAARGGFFSGADWRKAGECWEKAAVKYKLARAFAGASRAYEKASEAQEQQGAPWHAAKHLESAATCAKDASKASGGDATLVRELAERAAVLYCEAGRPGTAAEALGRHAKAVDERGDTDGALTMLKRAFELFADEEQEHYATDTYRAALQMMLRRERWADAREVLLKWAQSSERGKQPVAMCRCFLSAVVVALHAGDFAEAEQVFSDACQVDRFSSAEEADAGDKLLAAYRACDPEEVKAVVKGAAAMSHVENAVLSLARRLPGAGRDLKAMVGVRASAFADMSQMGEALDEDDLC